MSQLRTERPEIEMSFEKLRYYVLMQNEQMVKLNERAVQMVPAMQEIQEAIEALSF